MSALRDTMDAIEIMDVLDAIDALNSLGAVYTPVETMFVSCDTDIYPVCEDIAGTVRESYTSDNHIGSTYITLNVNPVTTCNKSPDTCNKSPDTYDEYLDACKEDTQNRFATLVVLATSTLMQIDTD